MSRMRIGELARRTGTTARALRYYEEQGLLHAARGENRYRSYGGDAVVRVRNIRLLLDAGLSTDDIRQLDDCLAEDLRHKPTCAEAVQLYERRLAVVQSRIDVLLEVKARLATALSELDPAQQPAARPPGTDAGSASAPTARGAQIAVSPPSTANRPPVA